MRCLLLVWLIVRSTLVGAQPAPPPAPTPIPAPQPDPAADEAKRHFDQGVALFNDANYSAALAEFEASYRLKPAPFVLLNIGLTQKALFRYAEAIASLQRYIDESPNLADELERNAEQIIGEMKALLADITVEVKPVGATIAVDGRPAGTAPLAKPLAIAAGTHTLEVTATGFQSQKRDLMVSAGVPATLTFDLVAIPRTGKVRISTTVPRAMISVDGKPIGVSPVEVELEPGGHAVEVSASGYQVRRDEIAVAAGQRRALELTLVKIVREKRWYKKWWVWTAAGVAVGSVTAFGLAGGFGSSQQPPLEGTLSPGTGGVQ
jgi:hypothetical protein